MKNILSIFLIALLLSGCSESFLDKQPEDTLSPGNFFKTPDDIKTGLTAVYQPLQTIFQVTALPHIMGQMSDDGGVAFSMSVFNTFYKTNSNSEVTYWNNFYKMIVNANNIIDVIDKYQPKNDAEAEKVNSYKGEARFLRAFAYFYLVRLYGDVPKVITKFENPGTAFGIGRTPVSGIFNEVIIPDLQFAFENCYKNNDSGLGAEQARATKGAALAFMGKAYLTMNEHAKAAETLKKFVVDKAAGDYGLLDDYGKIWLPSNKFNSESIFEVNYNVAGGVPSFYFRNMTNTTGYSMYGLNTTNGRFTAEKNLMDEFVASGEGIRYKVSVDSGFTPLNGLTTPFPLKLMPPLDGISKYDVVGTDYNYMITRYADVLLMYAEALMVTGQKDEAAEYVNQVRRRVNMGEITGADLDIDRILHERRMELAFEGHRYFDLVRTGKAVEYLSRDLMSTNEYEGRKFRNEPVPEYQLLLPIPVGEIEKDQTLTQNVGY